MKAMSSASSLLLAGLMALLAAPPPVAQSAGVAQSADRPEPISSSVCLRCHSNAPRARAMRDRDGNPVAPYDLWRGTMMANAARDPLWRAVLSAELAATPSRQAEIEAKCMSCHTPVEHRRGLDDHGTGSFLHLLECDSEPGERARDGVSCTICHGISPEGLGTDASFSAGFELDGSRLFGPHERPFPMPMRRFTGFTPTFGEHILDSALCGSCHTLETEALDPAGERVGATLLEQAPYLEWRNSAYSDEVAEPGPLASSCQDCHVPTFDREGRVISTPIARTPGGGDFGALQPRDPYGRHVFVGGNTLIPSLFRDHAERLGVVAPPEAFDATIAAARDQLRHRTARLAIGDVARTEGRLSFEVRVENLTGHKLPSAHPTRRAWLRVTVRDGEGRVLLTSGGVDPAGRIVGSDGAPLGSERAGGPIEPHRDVVRTGDQVATYQAVMADQHGAPTHTLMRGASWLVDDRLLPLGWSPDHPEAARTAPVGVEGDGDFVGGGDAVRYALEVAGGEAVTIEAELLYQTLSARWAAELARFDTPEIATFLELYEGADRTPETLARAVWPARRLDW